MHAHMALMQAKISKQKEEMKHNTLNPLVTADVGQREKFKNKK